MSSTVEQVKARLTITDVVGGYVKLDKAGVNYKGRCPFHNEKTASFFLSPGRESFHCFGCGKGGDIFTFVQEIEGLDFMGSLKMLAERAGVEIVRGEKGERSEKEKLLAIMTDSTLLFQSTLNKNLGAREYLHARGITDDTIRHFEIGYAADGWRVLNEELIRRGHDNELIEKAGMIIRSPKGPFYDRFRNRVMFPIKDQMGNVVGFSGRVLGEELPKYMNSPETALYQKSKVLFGIDKAKQAIRKSGSTVLVEGQMDLVLSHQAGVTNAIAVSGTALTEEHLVSLSRLANTLIMAFDADSAGIKAAGRALGMALPLGMEVRVALLPEGMDPADVVRTNPADWTNRLSKASHVIDFYLDVYKARNLSGSELRRQIDEELLPYVALLASSLDQGHFVKKIAELLALSETSIWEAVKKKKPNMAAPAKSSTAPPPVREKETLAKTVFMKLLGIAAWLESTENAPVDPHTLREGLAKLLSDDRNQEWTLEFENKKGQLALEAELSHADSKKVPQLVDELRLRLEEELLQEKFALLMRKLRDAETTGDIGLVKQYLSECSIVTAQITSLKTNRGPRI